MTVDNEVIQGGPGQAQLTPRQRQILKLLQAGKVNKEVARELDIGLGTVKQHMVALFKKLNASNRAQAVSHGMSLLRKEQEELEGVGGSGMARLGAAGLLESRPCVVLSIALPDVAGQTAVRLMYGVLADTAATHDAVFLARKGNAGDILFGVQRVTEYDVALALHTAATVFADLAKFDPALASGLRGCLTAGLAVASMKRFGGWTGEAIASAAIGKARELLETAASGKLVLDEGSRELIETFGLGGAHAAPGCPRVEAADVDTPGTGALGFETLGFATLDQYAWTGSRRPYPLIGRAGELTKLDAALDDAARERGRLVVLEGEMGMGKSRLCEEVLAHCRARGGSAACFRASPGVLGGAFHDAERGVGCTLDAVLDLCRSPPGALPALLVIDDFHLLDAAHLRQVFEAGALAAKGGWLVVLAGRRLEASLIDSSFQQDGSRTVETIALRRLAATDIETLVRLALKAPAAKDGVTREAPAGGRNARKVATIADVAAGVPLFAVELARHADTGERLSLPLQVLVSARLDRLHLDRRLLRVLALRGEMPDRQALGKAMGLKDAELPDTEGVAMGQQLGRAMAAGVLVEQAGGRIVFSHPLLQRCIAAQIAESP